MADQGNPPPWAFGRQFAAWRVQRALGIYERSAEAAERVLNTCSASTHMVLSEWQAAVGKTQASLERASKAACGAGMVLSGAAAAAGARRFDRLGHDAKRNRQALRAIAMRSVANSDSNIRAAFDGAEKLIQARDLNDFVAVQASYLREQTQRSTRQLLELGRATSDLSRRTMFRGLA